MATISIPIPHHEVVFRASGPELFLGNVMHSSTHTKLSTAMKIDTIISEVPTSSRRTVEFHMQKSGTYMIEGLSLYDQVIDMSRPTSWLTEVNASVKLIFLALVRVSIPAQFTMYTSRWAAISTPTYIFTRVQDCGKVAADTPTQPHDQPRQDSFINAYKWARVGERPSSNNNYCIVGGSHARNLARWLKGLWVANRFPRNAIGIDSTVDVYRVDTNGERIVSKYIDVCSAVVFHYGQWDLGWPKVDPNQLKGLTSFDAVQNDIQATIESMRKKPTPRFAFISTNYNPMNCIITSHPPSDWRSPPYVDMYNSIIAKICKNYNISFIDNNDIMGPVWDHAADWCHPDAFVLQVIGSRLFDYLSKI